MGMQIKITRQKSAKSSAAPAKPLVVFLKMLEDQKPDPAHGTSHRRLRHPLSVRRVLSCAILLARDVAKTDLSPRDNYALRQTLKVVPACGCWFIDSQRHPGRFSRSRLLQHCRSDTPHNSF